MRRIVLILALAAFMGCHSQPKPVAPPKPAVKQVEPASKVEPKRKTKRREQPLAPRPQERPTADKQELLLPPTVYLKIFVAIVKYFFF